jgi:hypothetical protein
VGTVPAVIPIEISSTGVDAALLICALFLQRFTLTFGHSLMELDIVPAVLILVHQFVSGRLLISYDRLLWFLAAASAVTCSLALNFNSAMLPSYFLFIVLYGLLTLIRPSNSAQYRDTLRIFQLLVALLSALAVLQFVAQFFIDGREMIRFYGIVPDSLFTDRFNTVIPVTESSSLIKSNGIFLSEPSTLSQITALAILIEVLKFRRPGYLVLLVLGLLLAYSGTGLLLLFVGLPLTTIRQKSARLPMLLVIAAAAGLVASGVIDLSAFSSRTGEFENTGASGFERFVSPFWLAKDHWNTASLRTLLIGYGPGTMDVFAESKWYSGLSGTWIKLFYEYGIIGAFVFLCFLASCLRKSRCPRVILIVLVFYYVALGGLLLSVSFITIMIVLCTLSRQEFRSNRETTRNSLATGMGR